MGIASSARAADAEAVTIDTNFTVYTPPVRLENPPGDAQASVVLLDVRGRIVQQPFALAQIVAQCGDPALRTKAGSQQPILVQTLQPLCVHGPCLRTGS
jgi:hypothetical protein